jgi:hypothetical protein
MRALGTASFLGASAPEWLPERAERAVIYAMDVIYVE